MGPSSYGVASFSLLSNGDGKSKPNAQTETFPDLVFLSLNWANACPG